MPLYAQAYNPVLPGVAPTTVTSQYDGMTVDSLAVDNRNIYDTSQDEYDNFLFRAANALHIKTRKAVIRREILLKVGEPYRQDLAEETARNLRSHLAIFDAWVTPELLPNGDLLVRVTTVDQWSLAGGFMFAREGNETTYEVGFDEKNLLGYNQTLAATYFVPAEEKNHIESLFRDRRILGKPLSFAIDYSGDPLDEHVRLSLGKPFYNLSQRFSWAVGSAVKSGRQDVTNDSTRIAYSRSEGERFDAQAAYRFGSYRRKLRLGIQYAYGFERVTDTSILTIDPDLRQNALDALPEDSLLHEVGLGVAISNLDFLKLQQIDAFRFTEDFTIGQVAGLTIARAANRRKTLYDMVRLTLAQGYRLKSVLLYLVYEGTFWFDGSGQIRRQNSLGAKYYHNALTFMTLAGRVQYLSDVRQTGAEPLTLGGTTGIRGFDKYFRTGDRMAVLNLECRLYPNLEFLSAIFGAGIFVDMGRTWDNGGPILIRDFLTSAGAGLRVSLERSQRSRLLRLDLSYSENSGWQLSVGTGQYFSAVVAAFS